MVQILENPFILIDGSSYVYRAYYTFPFMTNKSGQLTGVIYGVLNMLRSLLLKYQPTHAAIAFDTKEKTFRDKLFENYKLHRLPMPEDLQSQIEPLYAMLQAMGISIVSMPEVEADDVIGTLAYQAEKNGYQVLISTNDKDMVQLVTSKTTLMNTATNTLLGPEEIINKYGFAPKLIIDFLALAGDSSDNIPGVRGIGKKTAQALLQEFGGLNILYSELIKITNSKFRGAKAIVNRLKQNKEIAYLSYQLATIKTDVQLKLSHEQLRIKQPDIEKLLDFFKKYEFKRWTSSIKVGDWLQSKRDKSKTELKKVIISNLKNKKKETNISLVNFKDYEIVLNEEQLIKWIDKLKKTSVITFNTEVDSSDYISANLVGFSFFIESDGAVYFPLMHDYLNAPKQLPFEKVITLFKAFFEDEKVIKIGKNIKYQCIILKKYGIDLRGMIFDITIESYVLNSIAGQHDVNSLSERWLNYKIISFEQKIGKGKKKLKFNQIPLEDAGCFATEDVKVILKLHNKIWSELQKYDGLLNIFQNIEMPLVPVLSRIENYGVKINSTILNKHSKEIAWRLSQLEKKAYDIAGESFNLCSVKQLQIILFKKQGIKSIQKTPRGAQSTSGKVLEKLAVDHPLPRIILQYRSLVKLKSTYTDKLPTMINKKTGRIHTSYQQTVTTTGRLSSTDPNLQNIPIRNEEGRRIRQAFIAPKNYIIISADYSQIELRIMAHLSQDKSLLMAFKEGKDIHRITASEVFSLPIEKVNEEQRFSAKTINFGLIYGMSIFSLSRQLSFSYKETKKYVDLYFKQYPGVFNYIERIRNQAKEKGYVETIDKRRLYLPDIKSNNSIRRAYSERVAINAPIQGTAADIIKKAMISVDKWLEKEKLRTKTIMQVHDELVFEVHKDDVKKTLKNIKKIMENSMKLDVPLVVRLGTGVNWDQTHQDFVKQI